MHPIVWTPTALQHLEAAADWLSAAPDAHRAADALAALLAALTEYPLQGRPGQLPGTREVEVPWSAFTLVYRWQPPRVEVLALLHSSRKWL